MSKLISIPISLQVDSGTQSTLTSGTATAYVANALTDATKDFVTLGVKEGDTVTDTVNNDTALVILVAPGDDPTVLTLDADIFSAANETYNISVPANVLCQDNQNFIASVSIGDFVFNSTDSTSAQVTSIVNNKRVNLDSSIMAVGELYTVNSGSQSSPLIVNVDSVVTSAYASATSTKIYCKGDYVITLANTSDFNEYANKAIQDALISSYDSLSTVEKVIITPPTVVFTTSAIA
jgi:hypothetical protein